MGMPRITVRSDGSGTTGILEVTPTTATTDKEMIFRNLRYLVEEIISRGRIVQISVKVS